MKREQNFIKRITWLTASLIAGFHFLAAPAVIVERIQLIVANVKIDLQDCISQPILWKTMVSIFMPASIG